MTSDAKKLWGGCFSGETDTDLANLNKSLHVDCRLFDEDLDGSKAYAEAICNAGILDKNELKIMKEGIEIVRREWLSGDICFKNTDEDVHTVNERRLTELIGSVGGKLHTGRSRNDQVVTDMKLWLRKGIKHLQDHIKNLLKIMVIRSEELIDILMPGYTHMQRAQVVRFSHWLLSHAFAFKVDCERFDDLLKRVDVMPLGSGAIAGNPFPIDRESLAKCLNFSSVTSNSMMAVSDRDFVVEFLFTSSMISIHLSRFAEDLIIFSTKEFNFIKLADAFSTGSSLMPQKRNPDSLELIRGISGEIFGHFSGFMMTLKGLPSTYNKDLQSDKNSMFFAHDRLESALKVMSGVIATLTVNCDNCKSALSYDMLATDLAYYLVRKGIPFRDAHHASGEIVAFAEKSKIGIEEVPLLKLQEINKNFTEDISNIWSFENSAEQYSVTGGTSKDSVKKQILTIGTFLNNDK